MRSLHPALYAKAPPIPAGQIPWGAYDGSGLFDATPNLFWNTAINAIEVPNAGGINSGGGGSASFLFANSTGVVRWQSGFFGPASDSPVVSLGDPTLKWTTVHASQFAPNRTTATAKRLINVAEATRQTGAGATGNFATTPTLTDNAVTTIMAYVVGGIANESEGCGYLLVGTYRRAGAGPVICGAVAAIWTQETDATANATLVITGNTIEVQVTSPAGDTYDWEASVDWIVRP